MQKYIIKTIESDGTIYERILSGTNDGLYMNTEEPGDLKHLLDFLFYPNINVKSVILQTNNSSEVFNIGDKVTNGTDVFIIDDFIIYRGKLNFYQADTNDMSMYPLTDFKKVKQETLEQLEQRIIENNPRSFRLEKTLKKRKETLEKFLIKFFTEWNKEKNTVYCDDNTVQTGLNKRRSLGDIYMICKYYYPNCTLKEVLNLLYVKLPQVITNGFRTSYCNTIHKRVWYYTGVDSSNAQLNTTQNDEYGNQLNYYINSLQN